ncbi:antitoxin MazE family protein [Microcystis elabens FACHB-917]|nr:antitoxin MazE family protein [Microcystis elabens FACHB-917]
MLRITAGGSPWIQRPIQNWVPDVRSPRFASEARRQSLLANTGSLEAEDQAFVDAISLWPDQAQE